jgi:hypothetical protein
LQIDERPAVTLGKLLRVLLYSLGQTLGEVPKIPVQDAVRHEELIKALGIRQGAQRPTKQDSINSRQHTHDLILVSLQKPLHVYPSAKPGKEYQHAA